LAGRPLVAEECDDGGEHRGDGDADGKDAGEVRVGKRLAEPHRAFVDVPAAVRGVREHRAEGDERHPDDPPAEAQVELREQGRDRKPGRDERERSAVPREERALVGVGEPHVGVGADLVQRRSLPDHRSPA
jgi:hypothetical protein